MANNNENKILNVPHLRFPEFTGEWKKCVLQDVVAFSNGKAHENCVNENGDYVLVNSKFVSTNGQVQKRVTSQLSPLCKSQFVMVMSDLPNGKALAKCYYIEDDHKFTLNQRICSFTAKDRNISRFLMYQINRNKYYMRFDDGINQTNLKKSEVLSCPVFIPSIHEQEKIATMLHLLDERIATQTKIIEDLKKLKSAIYHKLFSNLQGKEQALSDLAEIIKGQQINGSELSESGKYYVMNGGIAPSGFYDSYNTEADTISISEGGNSCGYVQYNSSEFWSGGHCYSLRIKPTSSIVTQFLFHYLKWKETDIMALRIGSGLPNIQKKDLSKVCIAVPTLDKQQQLITLLSAFQMKIENEEMYVINLGVQKQYLLSQMFI
ncbi:restriction endonuclease subunit S [Parabacteroides distasonis]|uniref:Restriction endonuclease subunit S n=1 Tax=Parabacteroides distasonis TaxID=823 RepID=A0A6I2N927_PARDI|nr:restriction endonuclease subunit S [Parabacteroides distasonis]MRY83762.1 restriction endonuclease subunit S [Parabacteroides distasonis]